VGQYGTRPLPHNAEHAQYDKRTEISISATASISQSITMADPKSAKKSLKGGVVRQSQPVH